MHKRIPILPTLLVTAAILTMIALGVWQLQRLGEKEARIARYAQSQAMSAQVAWPRDDAAREAALYRYSAVLCDEVLGQTTVSGRSASGQTGLAQTARCRIDGGGEASIVLGWSSDPQIRAWAGGEARGFVAPGVKGEVRLIASPPLAGLEASAAPDPADMPNNHLAYAVQWFLFAAVAGVIYALALRKRLAARGAAR